MKQPDGIAAVSYGHLNDFIIAQTTPAEGPGLTRPLRRAEPTRVSYITGTPDDRISFAPFFVAYYVQIASEIPNNSEKLDITADEALFALGSLHKLLKEDKANFRQFRAQALRATRQEPDAGVPYIQAGVRTLEVLTEHGLEEVTYAAGDALAAGAVALQHRPISSISLQAVPDVQAPPLFETGRSDTMCA